MVRSETEVCTANRGENLIELLYTYHSVGATPSRDKFFQEEHNFVTSNEAVLRHVTYVEYRFTYELVLY